LLSRVNLIRLLKLLREKVKESFPDSYPGHSFGAKTVAKPVITRSAAVAVRRGDPIPQYFMSPSMGSNIYAEIACLRRGSGRQASTSLPRKDTVNSVIWRRKSIMLSRVNLILNT
jgi:hypothetical protein